MRFIAAVSIILAASQAAAARCPHGQMLRVSMGRCVSLKSPQALGYLPPSHWVNVPIKVTPPADAEPLNLPMTVSVPDPDEAIVDIPLTDPDPATMALKLQLEKK